ncbi:MAG: Mth938-like domain-containing protein [Pseudolabrys sp.]
MAERPPGKLPHLPTPASIDAYGNGGFRFGGMSHRGSLLCLPDGIWGWPVASISEMDERTLAQVFDQAGQIDIVLIGCGRDAVPLTLHLRERFRSLAISADTMPTGAAVRTYNILFGERRRVGAALIAVD